MLANLNKLLQNWITLRLCQLSTGFMLSQLQVTPLHEGKKSLKFTLSPYLSPFRGSRLNTLWVFWVFGVSAQRKQRRTSVSFWWLLFVRPYTAEAAVVEISIMNNGIRSHKSGFPSHIRKCIHDIHKASSWLDLTSPTSNRRRKKASKEFIGLISLSRKITAFLICVWKVFCSCPEMFIHSSLASRPSDGPGGSPMGAILWIGSRSPMKRNGWEEMNEFKSK